MLLLSLLLTLGAAAPSTSAASGSTSSRDLYKILGLSRDCTQKDIKKAYRRQSLRYHPDKVPAAERETAEERFKKIGKAYECLSDEGKRELYDKYGEASLDPNFNPSFAGFGGMGGGGGGSAGGGGPMPFPFSFSSGGSGGGGAGGLSFEEAASMFGMGGPGGMGGGGATSFGGFSGSGGSSIDLSQIFEHMMREQQHGVSGQGAGPVPFSGFGGMGGGHGFGPHHQGSSGMRSQQQRIYERPFLCSLEDLADIAGRTKKLKVKNPVTDPMTGKTTMMERVYTIKVKPGWKSGTKISFPAKDGFPPMAFVLKEKRHPYLKRDGNDLLWRCSISQRQADRGAKLSIPLPDGETLTISTKDQVPTRNGQKLVVAGKGMPIKGGPERGDLVIEFRIVPHKEDKQKT